VIYNNKIIVKIMITYYYDIIYSRDKYIVVAIYYGVSGGFSKMFVGGRGIKKSRYRLSINIRYFDTPANPPLTI